MHFRSFCKFLDYNIDATVNSVVIVEPVNCLCYFSPPRLIKFRSTRLRIDIRVIIVDNHEIISIKNI